LFDPEGTRNGVHSSQAARATVRHEGTRRSVRAHQAVGATVRSEDTRRSVRAYQVVGATVRPEGARRSVHPTVRQGVWVWGVQPCWRQQRGHCRAARLAVQRGPWQLALAPPPLLTAHAVSSCVCGVGRRGSGGVRPLTLRRVAGARVVATRVFPAVPPRVWCPRARECGVLGACVARCVRAW